MKLVGKAIAALAAVFVTLALGWVLVGMLWKAKEGVGMIAVTLIGAGIAGAAWRVGLSVWREEKVRFWWFE